MAYQFDTIAAHYDRLNRMMTLGLDRCWRKRAVRGLHGNVLDVACGTGDLAISLVEQGCTVVGVDISEEMLELAKHKVVTPPCPPQGGRNGDTPQGGTDNGCSNVKFMLADTEHLPFEDNAFDAVTCAFGVRNFAGLERGLSEMARVLKPGGQLVILELSYPESPVLLALYKLYTTKIIPVAGKLISGNREAYEYLPASILAFPKPEQFALILNNIGLRTAKVRRMTFGVCTEYRAVKPWIVNKPVERPNQVRP